MGYSTDEEAKGATPYDFRDGRGERLEDEAKIAIDVLRNRKLMERAPSGPRGGDGGSTCRGDRCGQVDARIKSLLETNTVISPHGQNRSGRAEMTQEGCNLLG